MPEFNSEKLVLNMVMDTQAAKDDHVRITLEWEQDPRSAVSALYKVATGDKIYDLFSAAQALVDGDDEAWDEN